MTENLVFILGDKLPTYYDAAIAIYSVATKPKSKKMNSVISAYVKALIDIWKRSFGNDHVMSRSSVTSKLQKLVDHYYNQVYIKIHRKSDKHKKESNSKNIKTSGKSSRQLNKQWRSMTLPKSSRFCVSIL